MWEGPETSGIIFIKDSRYPAKQQSIEDILKFLDYIQNMQKLVINSLL